MLVTGPQEQERRAAFASKAAEEVARLERSGAVMVGNAFSSVLVLKGEPNGQERKDPMSLLLGADGRALRASLDRLGYPPEDWAGMLTRDTEGAALEPAFLRLAVATLDPATMILCDETAADAVRGAYADDLVLVDDLNQALVVPGVIVWIRGVRVMNLGGFEAALGDAHQKQVMWARLKRLPPLGEPY